MRSTGLVRGDNFLHSGETSLQDLEFTVDGFLGSLLFVHSLLLGLEHWSEFGKRAAFRVNVDMSSLALVRAA
jgi:hypothetical protein